ncbi:VOC family protein [Mucilaginibacter segetis]|uniref:VOC family protein n=1 Tax=Mucilaginibacter segetis TaxID=2793071 RepID=A0A934PUR8_9SPHI|nr:VOC family protein [Mucilaginibacter segetis]MBK0379936.1 VOC family protein [Mucilaginibacter segetis]
MNAKPTFAPELFIPNGITDISFYEKAFGAIELRRFSNDDGTVHVSELSINGTIFHLHEQTQHSHAFSPAKLGATTVIIGLFVDDVHAVVKQAELAGAKIVSPIQDYDYGYRQATVIDPFGHQWQLQMVI